MNHSNQRLLKFKSSPTRSIVFNFPDELLNKDWEELKTLFPADYFLHGVFTWIFTGEQEPLIELLEASMQSAGEEAIEDLLDEKEDLIYKLAPIFKESFESLLKELVPNSFIDPKFVEFVLYDDENQSVYLVFEKTDDIDEAVITPTELIDLENEDEDDEESEEESDDTDVVEDEPFDEE
jgi:hypothetical protein